MSNSKTKFRYKLLAVALSVMMLIAMVPATVLTSAWGSADPAYDYLSAQGLTADYVAEDDSIRVSWTAIDGNVSSLSLAINGGEAVALDADANTYTVPAADYAGKTVSVALTAVCDEEGRTVEDSVSVPATLIKTVSTTAKMDNHSSLESILNNLPKKLPVVVTNAEYVNVPVVYSADGVNYNRDLATEQTFTVTGYLTLPETVVNRNGLKLTTSVEVTVLAAEAVAVKTDLDPTPINKMSGDSLKLSVEGQGTVMGYQWYRDGVAIDGATFPTLNIGSLTPADNGSYYCQIKGKGSSFVNSQAVTVTVTKRDTSVGIAVDPKDGQSRPAGVTLHATGIPADATGTLTFKANGTSIGQVTLPTTSIDFRPTGKEDQYAFSVEFSGDIRYNGSTSEATEYNFTKGTLFMAGINIDGGLIGKAGSGVQVKKPTVTPFPHSNVIVTYTYEVDNTEIAEVSSTGYVTYKKAGNFNLTITASAGNDYNTASIVIPVTVNPSNNSNLSFNTDSGKATYNGSNFRHDIYYVDGSLGNGELIVELESEFAEYLTAVLDTKNNKVVIAYKDDIDATDPNLTQTLTGLVKVTLTKTGDEVYNSISTEYLLTINKGNQGSFYFSYPSVVVTYSADANGNPLTSGKYEPVNGACVNSGIVYSTENSDFIELKADGTFTAIRPGTATITATKPGNGLYADAVCSYRVDIQPGTIEGFTFEKTETTSPFGASFTQTAIGGQSNAEGDVSYSISYLDPALVNPKDQTSYVSVNKEGTVSFNGRYFAVADKDRYTIKVTATKAACDYYKEATATYTLVFERKAVTDADFTLDGADLLGSDKILSNFGDEGNSADGITITPAGEYTSIRVSNTETPAEWKGNLFLNKEGKYDLTFYLRKENGEVTQSLTKEVILDEQGPSRVEISMNTNCFDDEQINSVWSGFTGVLSFDLWSSDSKTVTVKAEDELSDIHEIHYYVQTDGFVDLSEDASVEDIVAAFADKWVQCTVQKNLNGFFSAQFTIELPEHTNQKVVVYVKVVDAARNVSYFRSNGVVFDNIAPSYNAEELPDSIINITLPEVDGQVGLYNDDVVFDVTITDETTDGIASGIGKIHVTIEGVGSNGEQYLKETTITATGTRPIGTEFRSKDIDLTSFPKDITVTGDFIIPKSFNSNYLSILVEVWDMAGNYCSNENHRTYLAMDSVEPKIEIYYNDSADFFSHDKYLGNGQNRHAIITITEHNFDPAKVNFDRILLDGKSLGLKPTFTCVGSDVHGDGILWQTEIDFTEDGDYNLNISCTDKAENANKNELDFPEWVVNPYSWTIDNTKPVIHVVMTNNNVKNGSYFSEMRMATITITERNFKDDSELFGNWENIKFSNGAAPKAKLIKSDAETYEHVYTITFNKDGVYDFGVAYTDLAGNTADGYTCNAASYQSFTIDTTAPAISITGVEHRTAYDHLVYPIITCTDTNLVANVNPVRLTGANIRDSIPKDKIEEGFGGNITRISYLNGAITEDDIYTLSVTVADYAGNTSNTLVTFSVNCNGSNYELLTKDLNGQYLREERDVVFTETNVNELDHETLLIKMIKDGSPTALVEGTDYTIEKSGGDGQWSVYTYTIKKELFANDGHYNISVYSEDAAGNINESDDEAKNAEISFAIDKTAPAIVPIDLEEDTPYATDNKTVSVEIKDNLLLDGVKILLNGKEVEYTADGDNYTFDISESNDKQNIEIVAVDAAGNTLPLEVKNVLVNTNLFVRWFNNTPLFIGSLVGVVLLVLILTALALFGKKKGKN